MGDDFGLTIYYYFTVNVLHNIVVSLLFFGGWKPTFWAHLRIQLNPTYPDTSVPMLTVRITESESPSVEEWGLVPKQVSGYVNNLDKWGYTVVLYIKTQIYMAYPAYHLYKGYLKYIHSMFVQGCMETPPHKFCRMVQKEYLGWKIITV